MKPLHRENHLIERIGWLRAAVLGANDGIISTASLMVGVAAASTNSSEILVAGVALAVVMRAPHKPVFLPAPNVEDRSPRVRIDRLAATLPMADARLLLARFAAWVPPVPPDEPAR